MARCIQSGGPLLLLAMTATLLSQQSSSWRDTSPHAIEFVTVDKDVRLEVLDWGGSGRPVILLAGGGNTAHVSFVQMDVIQDQWGQLGAFTSSPPRRLDGGDIDLLHRHHRLEGTLGLTATSRKRIS